MKFAQPLETRSVHARCSNSVGLGHSRVIVILARNTVETRCRNELAEPHSFSKVERPEFAATHAVPFDRIAAIEQP